MSKSLTKEQFIERGREKHGDKYDYSEVEYVKNNSRVKIICPHHGVFEQTPANHMSGHGCKKCSSEKLYKLYLKTKEEFIEDATSVHGLGRYDYSGCDYKSCKQNVYIICPEHGGFYQTPDSHIQGGGCPKCASRGVGASLTKKSLDGRYSGIIQPEEYKIVPLTKGKYAIVDNEDFDKVKDINWYLAYNKYNGGYAVNDTHGFLHRFITNTPEGEYVDHIDRNPLNNRRDNLRECTHKQNTHNTGPRGGNFKGVSWIKRDEKWRARITHGGKEIRIGLFIDEVEAAKAYDKVAKKLYGEFAYLNFPENFQ